MSTHAQVNFASLRGFDTIAVMKFFSTMCALIVLANMMFSGVTAKAEQYILCNRDAQITPVSPDFLKKNGCAGTVKLQGIMYKCGKQEDVETLPNTFLSELNDKAKEFCEDYCQKRGSDCHGHYDIASKCAFTVPSQYALSYGKELAPCSPSCDGQAFIYCSLYHASFLRVVPKFFENKTPNCTCKIKKK